MTFAPYGEAIYGETFYGVPPSTNNLATSFEITPVGYNGLQIDWTLPPGDWSSQILVRSSFGTPTNIYAEDGITLLDETNPTNGYSSQFVDVGLASGQFYYYALFVFNTAGGLDQWQLAGSAQGLVIRDYNFAQTYQGWIPDWYFNLDQSLATTAQPDGPLERFLELIGYETDWLRSEIESFFLFTNPQLISGALLPYLGANYGMSYEPELGMARYRVLVENAVALYKSRGTGNGIAAAASAFTGYGAVVTVGKNLEIQLDDSAFDRSVGHWIPQTNGTSIQIVTATSEGVTPPHASYLPVPGDLSVDAAFGVNGYLPANNENVALIESVGAVYWTQQPFAVTWPSARSSFTLTYFPPEENVILFGGFPLSSSSDYLNDTWAWNGTGWAQLAPATSPGGRYGYVMAYHAPTETIFLYGGYSVATQEYLDDMWSWNGVTWTQVSGASMPGPLFLASMVYDPISTDLVLFGGTNASGTANGVTYLWNGTAWSVGATAPNGPGAREGAAMVYYPPASKVLLFGGALNGTSVVPLDDMWEWNGSGSTWTRVTGVDFPPARVGMSMVYDPNAAIVVLFGGGGPNDVIDDDTWIWDGTTWEQGLAVVSPAARAYYGLEWYPENNVFLLFGGENTSQAFNDFWSGSFINSPPISISTCTPLNATTLGIPVEQVATPPLVVVSASFTPVNQPNPVLRYIQMQLDWYTSNGTPISSSVGPPVQEIEGEWIRPYAVGSPPPGAYYYGRTVNMTSFLPPYVPPPIPNPPPPPYVPPVVGITPTIILGGRSGYADLTDQAAFITSLGSDPNKSVLLEFLGGVDGPDTWADVWDAYGGFTNFNEWLGPKAIKLPLQVSSSPGLWTDILGGGQDANLTAFFEFCVEYNVQHIIPMWEFNEIQATWPWGILDQDTLANQANFRNAWIHAWEIANTVAPGFFIWWWQPAAFCYENFTDSAPGGPFWPGNAYVNVIGMDVYNTYNAGSSFPGDATMLNNFLNGNTVNWNQCLNYALANNLDMGVSEWGMVGGSGPNGGDDATYVSNFWTQWVDAAIALAPNGNKIFVFPWENTGASPFSSFTNALAQLKTSVGNSVTSGYVAPPSGTPLPVISSLNPNFGATAGGTSVEIIGSNFNTVTAVKFGTTNATSYVVNSPTQITAVAPAEAAGVVSVTVATAAGISNTISYTYGSSPGVPTITGVSPSNGVDTGGTAVVITGTNFTGATAVKFGTTNATSFTVNSSTQITATAPAEAAATVDIRVTAPGGTSVITAADEYTFTVPPSGFEPNAPTTIGGVTVPTTLYWHDEFPGPTLNTTYWAPGYYHDGNAGGNSFGQSTTIRSSQLAFAPGGGIEFTMGGSSTAAIGGVISTVPGTGGGPWSSAPAIGLGAEAGEYPGYTGLSFSPAGGGTLSISGPIYVEFGLTLPKATNGNVVNWCQAWLVALPPDDSSTSLDELDVVETDGGTTPLYTFHWGDYSHAGPNPNNEGGGGFNGNNLPPGEYGTAGILWTTTMVAVVYNGVVQQYCPWTIPVGQSSAPMGIIVAQTYGSPNSSQFEAGAVYLVKYVRLFH